MARVKLCTNCKEINPANRTSCQKCRKDLKGRPVNEEDVDQLLEDLLRKEREAAEGESAAAAVSEEESPAEPAAVELTNYRQCDCGHRNPVAAFFCQSCGESLEGLMILTAQPEETLAAEGSRMAAVQQAVPLAETGVQNTPQLGQRVMLTSVDMQLRIPVSGRVVLGAENEGSAYFYDKTFVGRCHAAIVAEQNGVYIEDLNSRNGTYVDGRRISPGQRVCLGNGSEICLGGSESFCERQEKAAYLRLEIGV